MNPRASLGVIVGCGTLGTCLATELVRCGVAIGLVDREERALAALSPDLQGRCHRGDPLELDVLRHAGAQGAQFAVIATGSDDTNVAIALVCKRLFGIATVVARVRAPRRARDLAVLGIRPACPALVLVTNLLQELGLAPVNEGASS